MEHTVSINHSHRLMIQPRGSVSNASRTTLEFKKNVILRVFQPCKIHMPYFADETPFLNAAVCSKLHLDLSVPFVVTFDLCCFVLFSR